MPVMYACNFRTVFEYIYIGANRLKLKMLWCPTQPRPPGRPSALTTVSMGYVRLPGTRFGPSAGGFVGGRVRGADVGEGKYVAS